MKGTGTLALLGLLVGARAFAPGWPRPARTPGVAATAKGEDGGDAAATDAAALKATLLERVRELRRLQEEDGKIAVDFGVKGGELDAKSRAPRKLDFYRVSERVGRAADAIFDAASDLAAVNPTARATAGLGDPAYPGEAPLEGSWRLLFSTAADASFSKESKRGDATAGNIVDAKAGKITNVITFLPGANDEGRPKRKAVDQLRVKLSATAEGDNRVNLVFKYVAVKFHRLLFLPLRWTLYIPVPGPALGRLVVGLANAKRWLLRRRDEPRREPPKAFFDVLFLDRDLRVHRTGEGNLFVQARPEWEAAWEGAAAAAA